MSQPVDALLLILPPVFSAATLAAMHWFPWNGGVEPLDRVKAYTAGTLVVVGVPVITMLIAAFLGLDRGQLFWAALLVVNTLVSGGTVSLAYWIDSKRALTLEDSHAKRRS